MTVGGVVGGRFQLLQKDWSTDVVLTPTQHINPLYDIHTVLEYLFDMLLTTSDTELPWEPVRDGDSQDAPWLGQIRMCIVLQDHLVIDVQVQVCSTHSWSW